MADTVTAAATPLHDVQGYRDRLDHIQLSVLGRIVDRLASFDRDRHFPLHQGKSWFAAPVVFDSREGARLGFPLHHDGPPQGSPALLEIIAESLRHRLRRQIPIDRLQITNGITHGLNLAFGAVLAPGDEVMMLSPQWLFAKGIATAWGGRAIEVPYFHGERPASAIAIETLLDRHIGRRTRAVYFNSPNNPTGLSLKSWEVDAIGTYARAHGLTIISDNAYDAFDFSGAGFVDPAADNLFPDITISLYSFSKSFGWTGFRIGYMTMPRAFSHAVRVLSLHSIYCASTASQYAAFQGMLNYPEIVADHRERVLRHLTWLRAECDIPRSDTEGGFYTLLDVSDYPGGGPQFLEDAIGQGVSLAPGSAFGPSCEHLVRLCFTAVEEDRLCEALRILNAIYERR